MKISLGSVVQDTITGFMGTITARTEYLHSNTRVCVESKELHEGKPIEGQWFDESRLQQLAS